MYQTLLISSFFISFICATEKIPSNHENEHRLAVGTVDEKINKISASAVKPWQQHFWRPRKTPHNITFIDKAENLIRLPSMSKYYEAKKSKSKTLKKSPKRTIQKIIKKNRSNKIKKLYVMKMTSATVVPKSNEYAQDDYAQRKDDTTTQSNQRKRMKKYNTRLPRYPKPFHQMLKNFKRNKRQARDLFILKDLDEMQFLTEKKDYNVVNAHYKKYW
ncbi:uncharacterized protein LOC111357223 isoform X1 [Spodoptera litura]|uniref:Uncharacterized protein LOC111357223 isoform X1 n=1 Tax=Spodoptera litura TaxID=69820 RepID=A0A9J7EGH4_SPOLT|nr:uncharacterized protein LOC111357223 isoform X1 [Spodoptera litura]